MSNIIDAVFKLTDEFSKPLNNCISSLTAAGKAGNKARKQLADTGKAISSLGTKLTVGVTLPLVAAGTAAYQNYASVDKTLRLVQSTMGSTAEEAQALADAVGDAAAESVYSMQDAADAALNFARQGWSAQQAADMIAPAMRLAAGTETEVATVTEGLGVAMKAFNLSSEEATNTADVFAKAQAQANTTVTELFEAVSTGGAIFESVGWSLNDLCVVTDVFGEAGISASEGMNAMKTGLMRLASPTDDAAKTLKNLGVSIFDANGKMDDMVTVQKKLHDAFAKMDGNDEAILQAADDIFGKSQGSKWLSFVNAAPDTVKKFSDSLQDCSGTAQDMSDALMSGAGGALESLESSIDVLSYQLGELLGTTITPIVNKITEVVEYIRSLDTEQQKQIVKWGAIAAAVGPVLTVFGKLMTLTASVAGLISKISVAGGMAKAALAALSAPAAVVAAAIGAILVVVASVITHLDLFKAAIARIQEDCAPLIDSIQNNFSGALEILGPIISSLSDLVANVLAGAFQMLGEGALLAIDGITRAFKGIAEIIGGVVDTIKGIVEGDWTTVWNSMGEVVDGVVNTMIGLVEGLVGVIGGVVTAVGGAVAGVVQWASDNDKTEKSTGKNASGTSHWRGGLTSVNEQGGEIMDLPNGTRIIPHDLSRNVLAAGSGQTVNISGNTFTVREDADIDRITDALVRKLYKAQANMGIA